MEASSPGDTVLDKLLNYAWSLESNTVIQLQIVLI